MIPDSFRTLFSASKNTSSDREGRLLIRKKDEDLHRYDDIIHLEHVVSFKHPYMSLHDRAAQFAPFAALTGHGEAINETAQYTEDRPELQDEQIDILNAKMACILDHLRENPEISFLCFCPDDKKSGGSFQVVSGMVKKIDQFEQIIKFTDGREINMRNILEMDGDIFPELYS